MPLHLPDPAPEVTDKVKAKLHAFADDSKFTTKALHGTRSDQLDLSVPHQIYTIGLDDITAGGGLDRARPVGWRYLVTAGGQTVASAETTTSPDGTDEVSQFTDGPFVAATDKAVKEVGKLPQVGAAGFELRLLRVPALYMMALWLHAPTADLLVPLPPSPIKKDNKPIPAAEFFADLVALAGTATPPA